MTSDTLAEALNESELEESDILGEHTYEDALYTGEDSIGVINVLTEDIPSDVSTELQAALEHAERNSTEETPHVARQGTNSEITDTGDPYLACAFFHYKITGNLDWHRAFRAATHDPGYNVTHETNYSTGTLTITVEETSSNA